MRAGAASSLTIAVCLAAAGCASVARGPAVEPDAPIKARAWDLANVPVAETDARLAAASADASPGSIDEAVAWAAWRATAATLATERGLIAPVHACRDQFRAERVAAALVPIDDPALIAELETASPGLAPILAAVSEADDADAPVVVRYQVATSGCGALQTHNVFVAAAPDVDGGLLAVAGLPGATRASLALQRDAVADLVTQAVGVQMVRREDAAVAAGAPLAPCDPMASEPWVVDTAVVAGAGARAWAEDWTLSVCGDAVPVRIRFEETPVGARYGADLFIGGPPEPAPEPPG